ncbi:transposase [Pseudomonas lalucatii]|uniref:Transposase n=2 Tax=Pseudomonas lalucatii TaxID=1424203 RepID=A0ABS5PZT8_9PSED|nr:transposase [Pseudomonas lalucatii]MBS7723977.1 transposase [Pseudomonas lalucatii]QVM88017.1 transposase [Pseudomonas lalucatii]
MANRSLSKEIRTIHHELNGIYGHRRIKAELTAMGHTRGRHRVARLLREACMFGCASAGGWFPAVATIYPLRRITWIASSLRIMPTGTGSRI